MIFTWEPNDFESQSENWGLMASKGEELVIIGGLGVTSLRDGHHWKYGTSEEMATAFNEHNYVPVLAPINPSVIIRQAEEKKFRYGDLGK